MDNSTPGLDEQLVLYLDGSLEGAEKAALERLLETDPAVQAAYGRLQEARAAVQYYGIQQQVAALHGGMMRELRGGNHRGAAVRKMFRYGMAAAASLLLILGTYLGYQFFRLSPDRVFSAHYRHYEAVTMRGNNVTENRDLLVAYQNGRYQEVTGRVDTMQRPSQQERFLGAMSAMESRDDTRAIRWLQEIISVNQRAPEPLLNDEAEYYLALTYIRNKDFDFALTLLEKIKDDPGHTYHSRVDRKLIRKVRWLKWR